MMNKNFYGSPPDYTSYTNQLNQLKELYPFLEIHTIGQSVLSREIHAIGIGNQTRVTLFAGAFHAQEWLTCSLLMRYIEDLAAHHKDDVDISKVPIRERLQQRGIVIIPMVNPDGVSIALEGAASAKHLQSFVEDTMQNSTQSWQANAQGVDLNHNFNAGYEQLKKMERSKGILSPSPRQYGGVCAHSEPETRALTNFLSHRAVDSVYAFHSQGEEIFYEYGEHTPRKGQFIAEVLSEVSGYKLVKNNGLCSHGGFKDYFIEKYHRPGFTIEVGSGENPLPITDLDAIYHQILELLVIATVMV